MGSVVGEPPASPSPSGGYHPDPPSTPYSPSAVLAPRPLSPNPLRLGVGITGGSQGGHLTAGGFRRRGIGDPQPPRGRDPLGGLWGFIGFLLAFPYKIYCICWSL